MSMVAPACALVYFQVLGWWNPWLWGTCVAGLSIALCLFSVIKLHSKRTGLSGFSAKLVKQSDNWFPSFFVIVQSTIASLIVMFVWFSFTSLALDVPTYVDVLLVTLALLIPLRRYVAANVTQDSPLKFHQWNECLRGVWHVTSTVFLVRTVIGLTISEKYISVPENVVWQVMLWLPASLYIMFTIIITYQHLKYINNKNDKLDTPRKNISQPLDKF